MCTFSLCKKTVKNHANVLCKTAITSASHKLKTILYLWSLNGIFQIHLLVEIKYQKKLDYCVNESFESSKTFLQICFYNNLLFPHSVYRNFSHYLTFFLKKFKLYKNIAKQFQMNTYKFSVVHLYQHIFIANCNLTDNKHRKFNFLSI